MVNMLNMANSKILWRKESNIKPLIEKRCFDHNMVNIKVQHLCSRSLPMREGCFMSCSLRFFGESTERLDCIILPSGSWLQVYRKLKQIYRKVGLGHLLDLCKSLPCPWVPVLVRMHSKSKLPECNSDLLLCTIRLHPQHLGLKFIISVSDLNFWDYLLVRSALEYSWHWI